MTDQFKFKDILQSILPRGRIFNIKTDGILDKLITGISDTFQEVIDKINIDLMDITDPFKTVSLEDLEKEYGIISDDRIDNVNSNKEGYIENARRKFLKSIMFNRSNDGTAYYMQQKLRDAGFNVYVYKWNEGNDPATYLNQGYKCYCNGGNAYCGNINNTDHTARCSKISLATGFILSNDIIEPSIYIEKNRWRFLFFISASSENTGPLLIDWDMEFNNVTYWTPGIGTHRIKSIINKNSGRQSLKIYNQSNTDNQELYPDVEDPSCINAYRMYDLNQDRGLNNYRIKKVNYKNYILDGDCEKYNTDDWVSNNSAILSKDKTNFYSGSRSLLIEYDDELDPSAIQTFWLNKGSYTLFYYTKGMADVVPWVKFNETITSTGSATNWDGRTIDIEIAETRLCTLELIAHYTGETPIEFSCNFDHICLVKKSKFGDYEYLTDSQLIIDNNCELSTSIAWIATNNAILTIVNESLRIQYNFISNPGAKQVLLKIGQPYNLKLKSLCQTDDGSSLGIKNGNYIIYRGLFSDNWQDININFIAEYEDIEFYILSGIVPIYLKDFELYELDSQNIGCFNKITKLGRSLELNGINSRINCYNDAINLTKNFTLNIWINVLGYGYIISRSDQWFLYITDENILTFEIEEIIETVDISDYIGEIINIVITVKDLVL